MRWPDGVTCPRCSPDSVIKNGRDDTEPDRQRYECEGCRQRFDDLTDTIFAGHHRPLTTYVACLYFVELNLSGLQIAQELDINKDDARAMIGQVRQGIVDRRPPVVLEGEVEGDGVYVLAGHKGRPEAVKKGRPPRRRLPKGERGRATLAKEKPPIFGMIQRGGEVVTWMLADLKQVTIGRLIKRTIAKGALVYTDEYDIYSRLTEWGYGHETVCHAAGEYARDDDGSGFCEVHVNTSEGFWSLLRSWLRPHRGVPQESLPLYLGFFEFVHNIRARGKRLLGALFGPLFSLPRNPS